MNQKEFLAEFENVENYHGEVAEKIKSHNLPVIIFGAAELAKKVTTELQKFDVKILGYAVDEKYYTPSKTYLDLPIYNFDELHKTSGKYVFVLGTGSKIDRGAGKRVTEFFDDEQINKCVFSFEGKCSHMDFSFISDNRDKFFETYNLLEDDFSKKTFLSYLKAHITDSWQYIKEVCVPNEYFNEITDILRKNCKGYVDCGAYDGDSVEAFINFTNGNYKKIFAIEADPRNFADLEKFVHDKNYKNVECFNFGVWNEKGTISFKNEGTMGSKIVETGDIIVPTDTIDNIVGDEKISLIKMDIEGAELNALKGAIKTLKNSRPILALSAYHKKDDLITLPHFIKDVYGNCKFYLRKHEIFINLFGLDLYVIPE